MPWLPSSERIHAGPYPLAARERAMLQAKRWSSCQPASASRATASAASDSPTPRATSLRASSERECSRRTSSESARCAGVGSGRGRRGARGLAGSVLVVRRRVIVLFAGGLRHELLAQHAFDAVRDRRILLQELAGILLALADTLVVAAVPGAGLLDQPGVHAHLDELAFARDALSVEDLGDDLLERRRQLVLDHLDLGLVADDLVALLDRADAADVQAHRGVELERVATGGGFRTLAGHHDADLVAQLVDEDHQAVAALDVAGQLAQCLAHQAGLQAGQLVAHLALDLGARG